jgi:hypothetical protein
MLTRFLEDKRLHTVKSPDFEEICQLPLSHEPVSYIVIAKGELQRLFLDVDDPPLEFAIKLEVLSMFSARLGMEEERFKLDSVTGHGGVTSGTLVQFNHGVISRHVSLGRRDPSA